MANSTISLLLPMVPKHCSSGSNKATQEPGKVTYLLKAQVSIECALVQTWIGGSGSKENVPDPATLLL